MIHHSEARAERHGLFLIVGDHDKGDAEALLDIDELELRVLAQLLVERGEWLIEQQQFRTLDQRARQRHALPLPTGELVRLARAEAAHLHDVENLAHLAADLLAPEPFLFETEGDVALDAHVGKERV